MANVAETGQPRYGFHAIYTTTFSNVYSILPVNGYMGPFTAVRKDNTVNQADHDSLS